MKTFPLSVVIVLLLSGCGAFNKPYPEKSLHAIHLGDPLAASGASAASRAVLLVEQVNVAPPYDDSTFVYQTADSTFASDYYNGFVAPPARLISGELAKFLAKSGAFATILSGDSSADYQLALETNVTSMYGDYRPGRQPQAVITARFLLIDQSKGQYLVLFDKIYSENRTIEGTGSDALIKAWETGWTTVLTQLTADLRSTPAVMSAGVERARTD